MTRTFVEIPAFTRKLEKIGDSFLLQRIQGQILKTPDGGSVIPGLAGLRKLRVPDLIRGKGKRGGYRLIYLDLPHVERTYLFWVYGKGESEDISSDEKKILRRQVEDLKKEVM